MKQGKPKKQAGKGPKQAGNPRQAANPKQNGTKIKFDVKKEVRAIARERVGPVKAGRVIVPKSRRAKPKYKDELDVENP